jgi:hypothetical protein
MKRNIFEINKETRKETIRNAVEKRQLRKGDILYFPVREEKGEITPYELVIEALPNLINTWRINPNGDSEYPIEEKYYIPAKLIRGDFYNCISSDTDPAEMKSEMGQHILKIFKEVNLEDKI